ncbi:hypothetical protein [Acidithiobacillus ferrianus]|uniref:hypothetical protein n=1 Tax=Acidithiobacillus ferrianus TaxID=2678518 RepID=UPI0034E50C10
MYVWHENRHIAMTNNCWGFRKDIRWIRIAVFWGLVGIFSQAIFGHPVTIIQIVSGFFVVYTSALYYRWAMVQVISKMKTIVMNESEQIESTLPEIDLTLICGGADRSHHPLFDDVGDMAYSLEFALADPEFFLWIWLLVPWQVCWNIIALTDECSTARHWQPHSFALWSEYGFLT